MEQISKGACQTALDLAMARNHLLMKPMGAISSVGRALRLHRRCRQFEPVIAHHIFAFENVLKTFSRTTLNQARACNSQIIVLRN